MNVTIEYRRSEYKSGNGAKYWDFKPETHWGTPVTLTQDNRTGEFTIGTSGGGINKDVTAMQQAQAMLNTWAKVIQVIEDNDFINQLMSKES